MEQEVQVCVDPSPSLAGLAQLEAAATGSERVETHHVLLALLSRPSLASSALSNHGVTRELVEAAVRRVVAAGVREERHEIDPKRAETCQRTGTLPPSLQAERAFLGGIDEASRMGHTSIHSGHALLGLLLVTDGIAAAALRAADVACESVRNSVFAKTDQPSGRGEQGQTEPRGI